MLYCFRVRHDWICIVRLCNKLQVFHGQCFTVISDDPWSHLAAVTANKQGAVLVVCVFDFCYNVYLSAVLYLGGGGFRGLGGVRVQPPPKLWRKKCWCVLQSVFSTYQFSGRSMKLSLCKLLTVNWLKIQSKWLLSGAWFYALILPKIVCRSGSTRGTCRAPPNSLDGSWAKWGERGDGRARGGGKGRKGQGGGEGKGREGDGRVSPSKWKYWIRPCLSASWPAGKTLTVVTVTLSQ